MQIFSKLTVVIRKANSISLISALFLSCLNVRVQARSHSLRTSAYRKYFWGARQAYEHRDFANARALLRTFKELGSPSDSLIEQEGCDVRAQVKQFSLALRTARQCVKNRPQSAHWESAELVKAEQSILAALKSGDTSALEKYVDCAPVDLTVQAVSCQSTSEPVPSDLSRLASALKGFPEILENPNWREFKIEENDPLRVRWVLHSYSELWQPCRMEAAPILSLRQDANGQIRIAGFATSCLISQP